MKLDSSSVRSKIEKRNSIPFNRQWKQYESDIFSAALNSVKSSAKTRSENVKTSTQNVKNSDAVQLDSDSSLNERQKRFVLDGGGLIFNHTRCMVSSVCDERHEVSMKSVKKEVVARSERDTVYSIRNVAEVTNYLKAVELEEGRGEWNLVIQQRNAIDIELTLTREENGRWSALLNNRASSTNRRLLEATLSEHGVFITWNVHS